MIHIGIDPSINSTGVVVRKNDDTVLFYIIKPNKCTKNELKFESENNNFRYVIYDKINLRQYDNNNHEHEYHKTLNIINIACKISEIIDKMSVQHDEIHVTMEGISYGSMSRTSAIYDLAGLNYLIRYVLLNNDNVKRLTICPPSQVKKFATGIGNCKKETIINMFIEIYPEFKDTKIKIDDLADAYFMSFIE